MFYCPKKPIRFAELSVSFYDKRLAYSWLKCIYVFELKLTGFPSHIALQVITTKHRTAWLYYADETAPGAPAGDVGIQTEKNLPLYSEVPLQIKPVFRVNSDAVIFIRQCDLDRLVRSIQKTGSSERFHCLCDIETPNLPRQDRGSKTAGQQGRTYASAYNG
jgi:hypothetical protein